MQKPPEKVTSHQSLELACQLTDKNGALGFAGMRGGTGNNDASTELSLSNGNLTPFGIS